MTGETPISGFQKARLNIAKHMERIASDELGEPVEIPQWPLHDLRRTTAIGMARLNAPVRVTEAVLNHCPDGPEAGYALTIRPDKSDQATQFVSMHEQSPISKVVYKFDTDSAVEQQIGKSVYPTVVRTPVTTADSRCQGRGFRNSTPYFLGARLEQGMIGKD